MADITELLSKGIKTVTTEDAYMGSYLLTTNDDAIIRVQVVEVLTLEERKAKMVEQIASVETSLATMKEKATALDALLAEKAKESKA